MNIAPCVFQFLTDKIWWKNVKGSWGLARGKPHVWGIRLAVTSMISCWHLSNEKSPGCLGYIWDFTTHLHRDYDTPLEGPLWKNHYNGKLEGFFVAHFYVFRVLLPSQFEIEQLQIWKRNMTSLFCIPERMADLSCLRWGALQHVQGKSHHKQIHCGNVVSARPPSNNILVDYDFYNALPVLPSYCRNVLCIHLQEL